MTTITESAIEQCALAWLQDAGWSIKNGVDIAPGDCAAERTDYGHVILNPRLHDSAVKVLGDKELCAIARELVEKVHSNVTIDWTLRENVRAGMRVIIKRILKNHGYPPDKQERATCTVLEQAELLSEEWARM